MTTKLQVTTIIPAIPPIPEMSFNHDLNVHTDENLIMNAEEAQEFPTRNNLEMQKKFEEIGKKQFEDDILYKKSKHRKKRTSINTSTLSISSTSSEEKELNYTRPTIMNLSTVGVLPDLRSPESIKYDIEYKEKILADVLSLDKVKINTEVKPDRRNSNSDSDIDKLEICDKISKILSSKRTLPRMNGKADFPKPEAPPHLSILSKPIENHKKSNSLSNSSDVPNFSKTNETSKSTISKKIKEDTPGMSVLRKMYL